MNHSFRGRFLPTLLHRGMRVSASVAVTVLVATSAAAQLPQIRLTSVFPSGGQRGTSFAVTVSGGSDLDEASELVFSHPGITAVEKRDASGTAIANQFLVSIDSATKPGLYDVRVRGLFGISNPRLFRVDTLPETTENEPNNQPAEAQKVEVDSIINGRANAAADIDVYDISLSAGQTVVFRAESARLDSLMQPVMQLYDETGRRIARARRRLNQDAVIVYTTADNQNVRLTIHDTVYGGGTDYSYRLAVDTRPQIDGTFPGVVPEGQEVVVSVVGRNLPNGTETDQEIDGVPLQKQQMRLVVPSAAQQAIGTTSVASAVNSVLVSGLGGNLVPFSVADGLASVPESDLAEANSAPQPINAPCVIDGTFGQRTDVDVYRIAMKKGDQWHLEVLAERLGSTADPVLLVNSITKKEDGTESSKRIAREESGKQNPGGNGLPTLTRDPAYLLNAPEDGLYEIRLMDRYSASRGDPTLRYALVVRPPRPDFQAVIFESLPSADGKAAPSTGAVSLRKGGTYHVPVYVYRSGGHNDNIVLEAEGLPAGITMSPTVIRSGKSSAQIVFEAASDTDELIAPIRLRARSGTGDATIRHNVLVTTLVHAGANGLPRTGRVTGELFCAVMKDVEPVNIGLPTTEVTVSQDQQFLLPLQLTRAAGFNNKVDLAFVGVPKNIDIPTVSFEKDVTDSVARFYVKENAATGFNSVMLYATAQVSYQRNPWRVERAKAAVAAAVEQLKASTSAVAATQALTEKGTAELKTLMARQQAAKDKLASLNTQQESARQQLTEMLKQRNVAFGKLKALRAKLPDDATVAAQSRDDVAKAVRQVQQLVQEVDEAAKPIRVLAAKLNDLKAQQVSAKSDAAAQSKMMEQLQASMAKQQETLAAAAAQKKDAEAAVKAAEAARVSAEKVAQEAEKSAKPQNKNVRVTGFPVRLTILPSPGKLTASVPDGGAIPKGKSIDVPITILRKNEFKGSLAVQLVLPEGKQHVTSSTLTIAADETQGTLKLTAEPDAATGDIAHAVLRATGKFQDRQAGFDLPITLKVTD